MRFLSVADRELRAAARRSATYYVRWITGVAFFGLLVWLLWVFNAFTNQRVVPEVLQVFAVLIFFYCLIIGTARTADCLSSEKREGTLGLLYLTNLNSVEIVAGKLCSNALATVYGLVAIFPIMALPLLMGGVTGDYFWRTVLALLNAILFSLAVGFAASAVCVRQFPAVATATGLALLFGVGTLGAAGILDAYRGAKWLVELLAVTCPFYPLLIADGSKMFGANHYWLSLAVTPVLSLVTLVLVAGILARSWRDKPKAPARTWQFLKRARPEAVPAGRRPSDPALRRRLLDINPFYWLAGRKLVSAPVFMGLALVIVLITAYVTTPFFTKVMRGTYATMVGSLMAWLWAGMALHALSLYYAAMIASQRLAEDKQAGALEMILCTPTTERSISRGLWLAFGRRMAFPVLISVLAHWFFLWQVMIMGTLDTPGRLPKNVTAWELFWAALWNEPIRGYYPEWFFGMIVQVLLLELALLFMVWITCGWVGRWLGLRLKHPGFAPVLTLTLIFVPPILAFTFLCYVADKINLDQLPERQFIPLMIWVAFAVGVFHCVFLSLWAAGRLRAEFRSVVTSRFQPPRRRRWWLPTWRGVVRWTVRTAAALVVLGLLVFGFYGYQSWRGQRAWRAFQTEMRQRGETLDFVKLLPAPVPDEANFARTAAFRSVITNQSKGLAQALLGRNDLVSSFQRFSSTRETIEWTAQGSLPLRRYADWLGNGGKIPGGRTNNAAVAPVLLQRYQRHAALLAELAAAARLPHFQISGKRDATVVIQHPGVEAELLERLQFLFVVRAAAHLAAGSNSLAGDDVLTSLHLARLGRELPDASSVLTSHVMLARAFQPLWEGCIGHDWTEAQLAAVHEQLARVDLFAVHTNAIRRTTLAHVACWRAVAEDPRVPMSVPNAGGGFTSNASWQWQPRAWWYDRCLQLFRASQHALERVDAAGERLRWDQQWGELRGLSLDESVEQLIEPYPYMVSAMPNPTVLLCVKTMLNQALLAVALERYWVAHGKYPETLGALVPSYLDRIPHDVVTGRDMIYQRLSDAQYMLRSVGPDGDDDRQKKSSDDWLWAWPTNAGPAVIAPQ